MMIADTAGTIDAATNPSPNTEYAPSMLPMESSFVLSTLFALFGMVIAITASASRQDAHLSFQAVLIDYICLLVLRRRHLECSSDYVARLR
jgi:hypothetical protein